MVLKQHAERGSGRERSSMKPLARGMRFRTYKQQRNPLRVPAIVALRIALIHTKREGGTTASWLGSWRPLRGALLEDGVASSDVKGAFRVGLRRKLLTNLGGAIGSAAGGRLSRHRRRKLLANLGGAIVPVDVNKAMGTVATIEYLYCIAIASCTWMDRRPAREKAFRVEGVIGKPIRAISLEP